MSKKNGVFKAFWQGEERFFVIATPADSTGKTKFLDNYGIVWTLSNAPDGADFDVAKDVAAQMLKMKKLRDKYLGKKAEISAIVNDLVVSGNEVMSMSFTKNFDKAKAKRIISKTSRPLLYTYGFESRNPTTHRKPIDKDTALKIVEDKGFLDIDFKEDFIHLNAFSANDMF